MIDCKTLNSVLKQQCQYFLASWELFLVTTLRMWLGFSKSIGRVVCHFWPKSQSQCWWCFECICSCSWLQGAMLRLVSVANLKRADIYANISGCFVCDEDVWEHSRHPFVSVCRPKHDMFLFFSTRTGNNATKFQPAMLSKRYMDIKMNFGQAFLRFYITVRSSIVRIHVHNTSFSI